MRTRTKADKFPLWLHPSGQWCKKIRGRFHYFGTDRDEALKRFAAEWDDLKAGRAPRPRADDLTLADLCNHFLTDRRDRLRAGDLTARSWADYYATCEALNEAFGRGRTVADLRPDDFARLRAKAAGRLGPVALGNFVQRVRTVFKFGFDAELVAVPVRFGPSFAKPSRRSLRLARADRGPRLIGASDLRKLLAGADVQLKAMVYLGVNCGFGQTDCSELTRAALARPGWIDFRRQKTGTPRRAPLWPETVDALKAVAAVRPSPLDPADADCVFITRFGRQWVRTTDRGEEKPGVRVDAVGQEFAKLARRVGVAVPGPYTLRHVFLTVAEEIRDPVAVGLIMGHVDDGIAAHYREHVSDTRLQAVVDLVRNWLMADRPQT
jgi:integrase